ncbi:MAG: restriction endonuclease, partial [Jatrophihabitans sp.]
MTAAGSIRVAGGLLPPDVLAAVAAGGLDGLASGDYHLGGESPREAAAREWTHLLGMYRRFRDDLARLPDGDPATGITRERWLTPLLTALMYGRVPPTGAGGIGVDGKSYPVSHLWGATPMHLLGWGVDLDRRSPGVAGAAQRAPHAMVQELLNRTEDYGWAVVSNGRVLRLLRDSTSLTGQAYVEFDLEAMFDAELFADFTQLYLLAHQSRVEVPDGGRPADCWLERWRTAAISQGVRAMELLRDGVQDALTTLGTGFLRHPANTGLRARLDGGQITVADLHAGLLRTVYRLLFWFVAEDRDALLDPHTEPLAAERYRQHFSAARLREHARRRHGSAHHDLWQAATLVLSAL